MLRSDAYTALHQLGALKFPPHSGQSLPLKLSMCPGVRQLGAHLRAELRVASQYDGPLVTIIGKGRIGRAFE